MYELKEQLLSGKDKLAEVMLAPEWSEPKKLADLYCELTRGMVFKNEVIRNGALRHSDFNAVQYLASYLGDRKRLRKYLSTCEPVQLLCYAACSSDVRIFLNASTLEPYKFWLGFYHRNYLSTYGVYRDDKSVQEQCLDIMRYTHRELYRDIFREIRENLNKFELTSWDLEKLRDLGVSERMAFNEFVKQSKAFLRKAIETHNRYLMIERANDRIPIPPASLIYTIKAFSESKYIAWPSTESETSTIAAGFHPSGYQAGTFAQSSHSSSNALEWASTTASMSDMQPSEKYMYAVLNFADLLKKPALNFITQSELLTNNEVLAQALSLLYKCSDLPIDNPDAFIKNKHALEPLIEFLAMTPLVDQDGRNCLMWAAKKGKTRAVDELLNIPGIEVDNKDRYGQTAMMYALQKCYTGVANLIESHSKRYASNTYKASSDSIIGALDSIMKAYPAIFKLKIKEAVSTAVQDERPTFNKYYSHDYLFLSATQIINVLIESNFSLRKRFPEVTSRKQRAELCRYYDDGHGHTVAWPVLKYLDDNFESIWAMLQPSDHDTSLVLIGQLSKLAWVKLYPIPSANDDNGLSYTLDNMNLAENNESDTFPDEFKKMQISKF